MIGIMPPEPHFLTALIPPCLILSWPRNRFPRYEMTGLTASPPQPDQKVCRVLIVEDNPDAAKALASTLERESHEVQTTRNGTEALTVAASYRPHVLIDIGLPGLDGLHVAKQLRDTDCALLIIAATGRSCARMSSASRDAGCDHHLVKPLDFAAVHNIVGAWKCRADAPPSYAFRRRRNALDPMRSGGLTTLRGMH